MEGHAEMLISTNSFIGQNIVGWIIRWFIDGFTEFEVFTNRAGIQMGTAKLIKVLMKTKSIFYFTQLLRDNEG